MKFEDYEYAILSACFNTQEAEQRRILRRLAAELQSDRFTEKRGKIYTAILDAWAHTGVVDPLTVAKELGPDLDKVGGHAELRFVKKSWERLGIESAQGLKQWAVIIDNAGRLRQMGLIVREKADQLKDFEKVLSETEDVDAFIAGFISELRIAQGTAKGGYEPIAVHVERWERVLELQAQGKMVGRLLTGWRSWDQHILGLPAGKLTVLCGLPSTGKTQLAWQLAYNVAKNMKETEKKGCVVVNSLEMPGNDLVERLACALAKVDSRMLQAARIRADSDEYRRLKAEAERLKALPLYVDDSDFTTSSTLELQASIYHAESGPIRLMVVDFAELVQDERVETEELRVSGIYRKAKALSKNLGISVVLLAQYSRSVKERLNKLGTNFDIRYSGMAEIAADLILHIYNPYQLKLMHVPCYNIPKDLAVVEETAYVIIGKNKGGQTGSFRMQWVPTWTYWGDEDNEEELGGGDF